MQLWEPILIVMVYAYLCVVIVYLLLENRETSTTFSWLLVFIFMPFVGIVLYFLFGRGIKKKVKKKLIRQDLVHRLSDTHDQLIKQQEKAIEALQHQYASSENKKLIRLLYKNSDSILTRLNTLQVFFSGKEKFEALIDDLKNAKDYIHMEYFIWKADNLTAERNT